MKKLFLSFLILLLYNSVQAGILLDEGFESGGFGDNWSEQSCQASGTCGTDSVSIQTGTVHSGTYALKVFIDTGDYMPSGKRRAELVWVNAANNIIWLSHNTDYEIDFWVYPASDFPVNTWEYSVMQLHAGALPSINLTSSATGQPQWQYFNLSSTDNDCDPHDLDHYYWGTFAGDRGTWNHIILRFKLTADTGGYIDVWHNDIHVVNQHNIRTSCGTCGAYFKIGLYCGHTSSCPAPATIYLDDIIITEGGGPNLPSLTTQAVTDITTTTAIGHGIITNTGGENATKRGICWNITGSPTVANDKIEESGNFSMGAFSGNMTGLVSGQHYYVKPYAYNTAGYGYGSVIDFTTSYSAGISQAGWSLHYVDSEEVVGESGNATNSFDGNINTFWHTEWDASDPPYPHEIQINLGASYDITGFNYIPRQDESPNGRISQYEFYVSTDGATWGIPASNSTFANDASVKIVNFSSETGQYVRLKGLNEVGGNPWASMAELNVLATGLPGINNPSRLYGIQMIGCEIK